MAWSIGRPPSAGLPAGNVFERLEKLAAALVELYGSIDVGATRKLDPAGVEEARRSYYQH